MSELPSPPPIQIPEWLDLADRLVAELPQTHLGKIDRGALKRPAGVEGAGR